MTYLLSKTNKRISPFVILLSVIVLGGVSQGLLLPLLSIFMEEQGIPSSVNGMHAAALYIGSFAMSLVAERVLGVTGFKKLLLGGLIVVLISLPLFPLVTNLKLWFILRLLVGIGDSAIHFTSQLWLVLVSPPERRGRNISLYGMSYGLGFSLGPLGIHLLPLGKLLPFVILAVLFVVMIMIVIVRMPDMHPEKLEPGEGATERKYTLIYKLAWFALLPSLLYGYMESSMNSNFPIYGLRIGLSTGEISTLLPFFGIGGLILQLPLGILSDRFGRKGILMVAGLLGGLMFLFVPLCGNQFWALVILFMLAGGLVGSFFSLGLAYAADLLPRHLIPAANVIASFHFSFGSIIGPNLGGQVMEMGRAGLLFTLLGSAYVIFSIVGLAFRKNSTKKLEI
ncbi:Predicted arabinose efflux permease, MFS family [Fontibacillus panacisegetis]|uniref:Predicted arabinose efflux permease, MFS family n=1 Tax=Fontibacillus panacisegetis TaxID=670482 RepID=A0A1G7GIS3_9BACL|nr:MFS transporter [Fontibacillus panacisegetis]SDE88062.1 Predicted arabinose efflux permease, MFS family [Fontibacillus panacisegetis]